MWYLEKKKPQKQLNLILTTLKLFERASCASILGVSTKLARISKIMQSEWEEPGVCQLTVGEKSVRKCCRYWSINSMLWKMSMGIVSNISVSIHIGKSIFLITLHYIDSKYGVGLVDVSYHVNPNGHKKIFNAK